MLHNNWVFYSLNDVPQYSSMEDPSVAFVAPPPPPPAPVKKEKGKYHVNQDGVQRPSASLLKDEVKFDSKS